MYCVFIFDWSADDYEAANVFKEKHFDDYQEAKSYLDAVNSTFRCILCER